MKLVQLERLFFGKHLEIKFSGRTGAESTVEFRIILHLSAAVL
jgi:hypothetical protein